jgi:hypothetical protein
MKFAPETLQYTGKLTYFYGVLYFVGHDDIIPIAKLLSKQHNSTVFVTTIDGDYEILLDKVTKLHIL